MALETTSSPNSSQDVDFKIFVGRQAIFDTRMKVYAYELLFRSGIDNAFPNVDWDQATSHVISESFFNLGINNITGGNRASINFTRNTLLGDYALLFPKNMLIVEILEDVKAEPKTIDAVRRLKEKGYTIALDNYRAEDQNNPFIEFADIIKVDFLNTAQDERSAYAKQLRPLNIQLLAEKVETQEDFKKAKELGYSLFQGYFFCKPTVLTAKKIPESKATKLLLLQEVNKSEMDFKKIEEFIKQDVSLSFKLLRYINSVRFGLRQEVTKIGQTLTLLGQKNIRKWVSLVATASLGFDKPPELVTTAIVRAHLCELMAKLLSYKDRQDDLFLMGMFSTLDGLLDMKMDKILQEIPIPTDIQAALLGDKGHFSKVLNMAVGYESGDWYLYEKSKKDLQFDETTIPMLHFEAVKIAEEFLQPKS